MLGLGLGLGLKAKIFGSGFDLCSSDCVNTTGSNQYQ